MDDLKQIMYGVTDFALMRSENAYFVDRTAFIRELEKTRYALFLRPRRFGKSLLCSILQCYYDIDYAKNFDEFFGALDIGRDPTPEHGKYLFLDFNFSQVAKQYDQVQESFNDCCNLRIDKFARDHAAPLPRGAAENVLSRSSCHAKLNALATDLKGSGVRLYIVIDEYDNFTNTILAESRDKYEQLCHGDGFFKQFFNELKAATTGTDAPVTRLFVTGVTPVTMDDVTSGFNFAFEPQLNRWPKIGHAAIVELKYIGGKAGRAVSPRPPRAGERTAGSSKKPKRLAPSTLAKIRREALDQMTRYAADRDLARQWNLRPIEGVTEGVPGGTVTLHRIVLVFRGGDVVHCEEA